MSIFIMLIVIMMCIQLFITIRLNDVLDRVEDGLVDIEVTYERMRVVIDYLKECIEHSDN